MKEATNEPIPDVETAPDVFEAALAASAAKTAASKKADETYLVARAKWLKLETLHFGSSDGDSRLARIMGLVRRYGPIVAALGGGGTVVGSVATALSADEGGFSDMSSLATVIGQLFGVSGGAP